MSIHPAMRPVRRMVQCEGIVSLAMPCFLFFSFLAQNAPIFHIFLLFICRYFRDWQSMEFHHSNQTSAGQQHYRRNKRIGLPCKPCMARYVLSICHYSLGWFTESESGVCFVETEVHSSDISYTFSKVDNFYDLLFAVLTDEATLQNKRIGFERNKYVL